MDKNLTEIMRLITNLIRTGVVTEVDRENWLCRVKTGDLETNWISWLTLRAGNARTWWRPSEGEQVVLLSLGGKQPIDDAEWTITTLTHTVSPDNGFTTSLELEVRIDDFEME
ncbi:phage baseplate assembly protein [Escherichia coli]|nr:phage baseplate assembly protein [Escherichia coli]